ncbi:MAG: hypothetical protein M3463_04670, partial [Verrucomicrobiota bacterium]|nr:hypothetical protein [Verrucomicrobiota bacterium]
SDPEIVRLAREDYVAVACDDWYQRRRRDAEGKFFIGVANQGPRKGEGGGTRQGIYVLTASGKLLAYKNAGQSPEVMLEMLREGLAKWKRLPQSERVPGALKVPAHGKVDTDYHRQPPPGGIIIKVHARALDYEKSPPVEATTGASRGRSLDLNDALFADAQCKIGGGDEASRDHLWLTEPEWRSLIPEQPQPGARSSVPANIAERILRFHLLDNTRGEPPMWRREEIRARELDLIVQSVTPAEIQLRLEGSALLATEADLETASRGYQPRLLGFIKYDRKQRRLTQFDLVAVGDHWGGGPYTRNARPGRTPLGVAFELSSGESPADRIAPQGARELREYFGLDTSDPGESRRRGGQ